MSAENQCSPKLRVLALVVITANVINERATPSLGISHAIVCPLAIFTAIFFYGIMLLGSFRESYASYFLEIYALIAISITHIILSIVVFQELGRITTADQNYTPPHVLNGVLPMFVILITLGDLIVVCFTHRVPPTPELPESATMI